MARLNWAQEMRSKAILDLQGLWPSGDIKMVTLKCSEGGEHRLGLEEGIREGFPEEVIPKRCYEDEYPLTKVSWKEALRTVKRTL